MNTKKKVVTYNFIVVNSHPPYDDLKSNLIVMVPGTL